MRAAFQPRTKSLSLLVVGGVLAILGALGLGATLWLGGPDPSLWFIIPGGGEGKGISGWTLTLGLASALAIGTCLLVVGRRRRSS